MNIYKKTIAYLFYTLFFMVPLVLFPKTSELFEFNKMVLTYLITILVAGAWLLRMVAHKKFIFKKSLLDVPLLIFIFSQILSTLVSFDARTSLLGYYSRFHGGLFSTLSYSILYWAFVSNMDEDTSKKTIYSSLISAFFVSIYGILQHFGVDAHIWVQDVQNRIFSTLGQPNWLAAWIVALTPLTWGLALHSGFRDKNKYLKIKNFWIFLGLSSLFFISLLYTKSRSGILGFLVANGVFWTTLLVFRLIKNKKEAINRKLVRKFVFFNFLFLIIAGFSGTPWTPNFQEFLGKLQKNPQPLISTQASTPSIPAMERGGTASREIRKIVWTGAIDIFKAYPILGTGVETFAYSYYNFRPEEHNLVSEWDFLYNKAHNEYLNIAATTGGLGIITYSILILSTIFLFKLAIFDSPNPTRFLKNLKSLDFSSIKLDKNHTITIGLISGYTSILVTNFFGFSVVPVALQFFLFPAIAVSLTKDNQKQKSDSNPGLNMVQKIGFVIVLLATSYLLLATIRYWYADTVYNRGKLLNDTGNYSRAREELSKAVNMSPSEAVYWDELAQTNTNIAVSLHEAGDEEMAQQFASQAISSAQKAESLSPKDVNIKRKSASMYIKLSSINQNYLIQAKEKLDEAIELAPTDAKLWYNLGLAHIRTGELQKAIDILQKTTEMKANYREARFALGLTYFDEGEKEKAIDQLEYILENIDPNDQKVIRQLQEIKN